MRTIQSLNQFLAGSLSFGSFHPIVDEQKQQEHHMTHYESVVVVDVAVDDVLMDAVVEIKEIDAVVAAGGAEKTYHYPQLARQHSLPCYLQTVQGAAVVPLEAKGGADVDVVGGDDGVDEHVKGIARHS